MNKTYTHQQQGIIDGIRQNGWCHLQGLGQNDFRMLASYSGRSAWTIKYRDFATADAMPPAATITALSLMTGIDRDDFVNLGSDPRLN